MANDKEICALLERFVVPQRLQRLESVLSARTNSLTVVLENVRNPHNISAVLRSADAFGINTIHLLGSQSDAEFEYSSGISLGTERWMQLQHHDGADSAIDSLLLQGYEIVVLQPENDTRCLNQNSVKLPVTQLPVTQLPFEKPLALVFGNEHSGVSKQFVERAKYHAFIPMFGFVESFNISVACAITLFCSTISPSTPQRRCQPLADSERENLRAKWLQQSVRGADIILRDVDDRDTRNEKTEP